MGYCSKCGSPLSEEARFCPVCGVPVAESEPSTNSLEVMEDTENSETSDEEGSQQKEKVTFKGIFLLLGIGLVISLIFSRIFCHIDPSEDYSFISAIWHGLYIFPNWILSLFTDTVIKAEDQSAAYNLFFWASAIVAIGIVLYNLAIFIGALFTKDKEETA